MKISHRSSLNHGAALAVRPSDGAVFAVYRSFSENKIYITHTSGSGSSSGFSQPQVVSGANPILPFDQPTLAASDGPTADGTDANAFRTNGFPTIGIDGPGRVYVAWQERLAGSPTGKPAITITMSSELARMRA